MGSTAVVQEPTAVVVIQKPTSIVGVDGPTRAVTVSSPGPQGIPGLSGGAYLPYTAATALSGHRVVAALYNDTVGYADSNNPAHARLVLGITIAASAAGAVAQILASGPITEPTWNWTEGLPIFVGPNGTLTQTPPTIGFSMVIGTPTSPTSAAISLSSPIIL